MNTRAAILFLILTPVLNVFDLRSQSLQRNRPPKVEAFTPNEVKFELCPLRQEYYILKLEVKASDPDNESLTYRYFVSAGRISAAGAQANWDLRKAFGRQEARVEITDRRGAKAFSTIRINVVPHGACDFPCTVLHVSSAPRVIKGGTVSFIANITGPVPPGKLQYHWSQTNGRIVGGQGTKRLRVKAIGLPGTETTATVNVRGVDPTCNSEASGRSKIQIRE